MTAPVDTLKAPSEFQRLTREGKRWVTPSFILLTAMRPSASDAPLRFGFTVSRKVGGAVVRNRVRRRLREAMRKLNMHEAMRGRDIVLIARKTENEIPFDQIGKDVLWALKRLEILP